MIELPEAITIAQQINDEVKGKTIESSIYMDSTHKFAFYNKDYTLQEHEDMLDGRQIGHAKAHGSTILVPLEPDYVLKLGDGGERILFHQDKSTLPKKRHLLLQFEDYTFLTVSIQGWGNLGIYPKDKVTVYGPDDISPLRDEFTFEYFQGLFEGISNKKSVKYFVVTKPGILGVANGCLQDILFRAKIHPRRKVVDITEQEKLALYDAIRETIIQAVDLGGRDTEKDLYNQPGRYPKILDSKKVNQPCPECGTPIEKIQYLGGSCYLCPSCQEE